MASAGFGGPTTALFHTAEGHGQSVKFSPFSENRLACAAGTEYGLQGEGYLYVLEKNESGQLELLNKLDYRDNFFDMCWSETDPNILATSAGDGFVQVWNLGSKYPKVPIHEFKGHRKEMSSLDWNLPKFSNSILAASWDGTVCLYDVATASPWPTLKMTVSDLIVYQAVWSPHTANSYISASSDGVLQLWDVKADSKKPQIYLSASDNELLTCDWAKYTPSMVITAGADCIIRGWDLRNYSLPLFQLEDHGHAVKKIKFSPFHPTIIASASYDFTVRIFDYLLPDVNLEIINHHTEFVYGLDWNLHKRNELVSCAWDQTVKLCQPNCLVAQENSAHAAVYPSPE